MFNTFLTFQPNKTRFLPFFHHLQNDVKKCPFLFYPVMQWRGSPENGAFLVAILQELS